MMKPETVLSFWFAEDFKRQRDFWFKKDLAFDDTIRTNFLPWLEPAKNGVFEDWTGSPEGALALTILLDQFPRNIYRGTPRSFAYDSYALDTAKKAVAQDFARHLTNAQAMFLYLPFEHAEKIDEQLRSVGLFERLPDDGTGVKAGALHYAILHRDIIQRFGRFPHRNAILGRVSTPEELTFLKEPNSSF